MGNGYLHLLCGKMASGKSTLASELGQRESGLFIAEDDLLTTLYPNEVQQVSDYLDRSARIKNVIRPIIVSLLRQGACLIMDFPANTPGQRTWLLDIAQEADVAHTLHYLECPDSLCLTRLEFRRSSGSPPRSTDTPAMFHAMTKFFDPPSVEEGFSITVHRQSE
ncbi:MAG: AAA family ATPase [Granulosicoccus sp.]